MRKLSVLVGGGRLRGGYREAAAPGPHDRRGAAADHPRRNCGSRDTATPCVPRAEITADGVDQDCDLREVCWQDDDDDGSRSETETVASEDLDCDDGGEGWETDPIDCDDTDDTIRDARSSTPTTTATDGGETCEGPVPSW